MQMGSLGMLGMAIPEEYGARRACPTTLTTVVMQEEARGRWVTLSTVRTQLEVILPYFLHYANARTTRTLVSRPVRGAHC